MNRAATWILALALAVAPALAQTAVPPKDRHVIYLHGRIVQEEQSPRPRHPRFGYYELNGILDAFRKHGFVVTGEIRPKEATVDQSADHVVEQVRKLLESGVAPGHITVVGASMGAGIALVASARLQNPEVRFAVLGTCLSANVRRLSDSQGKGGPAGHILAIRESSDEVTGGCSPWKDDTGAHAGLVAREIVLDTGLHHGFLYRPMPEWLDPVVEWINGADGPEPPRPKDAGDRSPPRP